MTDKIDHRLILNSGKPVKSGQDLLQWNREIFVDAIYNLSPETMDVEGSIVMHDDEFKDNYPEVMIEPIPIVDPANALPSNVKKINREEAEKLFSVDKSVDAVDKEDS